MGKKSKPGLSAFVVSYVPLLVGPPGMSIDMKELPKEAKDMMKLIDQLPDGRVSACLWITRDGHPLPIFAMDDMQRVVDHLEWWSEGKPVEWLDLQVMARNGKYAIALAPKLTKSVERWNLAYQLRTGYPAPDNTHYSIVFRSLHFISGGTMSAYHQIADQIGSEMSIGFIDTADLDSQNPGKVLEQDIRTLGPFPVNQNSSLSQYIGEMLDDAKEPATI